MTPAASLVLLNWNGGEDTICSLRSLARSLPPSCRVLVVDNHSTDGSVERIRKEFPQAELLLLPANLGYAGGNNAGFRRVQDMGAEYVIFLNNDTVVDTDFCTPLLETLQQDPRVGIAVPKIFYFDRPDILWYAGGEVSLVTGLIRHLGLRKADAPEFDRAGPTGYATGCCLAMRCRDFQKAGGFDESFRMYAEDVDLSLRIRSMGMSIAYVPSSKVWHKVSASLPQSPLRKGLKKTFGALHLFRKHRAWSAFYLYLLLLPLRTLGSLGEAVRMKGLQKLKQGEGA